MEDTRGHIISYILYVVLWTKALFHIGTYGIITMVHSMWCGNANRNRKVSTYIINLRVLLPQVDGGGGDITYSCT